MHPSPLQRAFAGGLAVLASGGCVWAAALPEVAVSWCFWLALPLWAYARCQMSESRAAQWSDGNGATRAMLAISLVLAGGLICHMLLNPLMVYVRAPDRLYPVLGLSALLVGMIVAQWRSWPWFGLLFVARLHRSVGQSLWASVRERADELSTANDAFFRDGLPIAGASLLLLIAPVLLPLWPATWSRYSLALLLIVLLLALVEVIFWRTTHALMRPSGRGPRPSFLAGTADDEITDPEITVVEAALPAGPNEDLLQAARRGDGDAVQRALALGADCDAVPGKEAADQRTALIAAATAVDRSALRALIAAGAQVNRLSGGLTALLAATRDSYAGRVDAVMTLLSNGADPNLADESGNTALHFAALTREASVAHCLLDAGARMDAINREDITPLALACEAANWVVVEFLIKHGARADVAGATPALLFAAAVDGDDPRGVKLLLKSRAKVNATGPSGRTALMVAALADNAEIAEALLAAGADIEARDESGHSALLEAARAGANRMLRRLVSHRPDAQLTDIHGRNALHLAAQAPGADVETLTLLQELGCPADALDQSGASAADLAAAVGRWPLVRVLNPDYVIPSTHLEEPMADEETPHIEPDAPGLLLVRAALQGRFPLYQELVQIPGISAAELTEALQVALPHQDRRYIDTLLERGYDAFARTSDGPSLWERLCAARPLSLYALEALLDRLERHPNSAAILLPGLCQIDARAAAIEDLQRLRERVFGIGADVRATDHRGVPVLHLAIGALPLSWIERLVAAGVDANARDAFGQSALITLAWARRSDAREVAPMLIRAGADPALTARDGSTPAAIARLTGQAELAEVLDWPSGAHPGCPLDGASTAAAGQRGDLATLDRLLSLGLDIDGCDSQGATALLHAAGTGQLELCKALVERGADPARKSAKGVTPLAAAILAGRTHIVEWLLARGVQRETVLLGRMTALGLAAACLRLPLIEILLAAGADPEGRAAPDSPLQSALGQVKDASRPVMAIEAVMSRLIEAGANPDLPDADGRAALHRMFGAGRTEPPVRDEARLQPIVLALLLGGANPNLVDREGRTALHWACRHGLVQCGGTLLELGADPRVLDNARQLPIDLLATRHRIHLGPALRQAAEAWNRQRAPHR